MNATPSPQVLHPLVNPEQLDDLIDRSRQRPVVIFKHSRACGTSAQAFDELQSLLHEGEAADVYLVDVLRHRSTSQAVASRFGIRHESPQVLVLRDGQVGWHGSHFRVTVEAIRQALVVGQPSA
jgi:bacillithiol system protein YtxJ